MKAKLFDTIMMIFLLTLLTKTTLASNLKAHETSQEKLAKKTRKYTCFCIGCQIASVGTCCATDCSDINLKENIKHEITLPNGIPIYSWTWNELATQKFGRKGSSSGVLAQEILEIIPNAVQEVDGYLVVDYEQVYNYKIVA